MNEQLLIIFFILAVSLFIFVTDRLNQIKLKNRIKKEWGHLPASSVKDREESLVKAYRHHHSHQQVTIDDLTWNDLDMFDVYNRLNLTYSSIGSEALYKTLREYNLTNTQVNELETLVSYFKNAPLEREAISFRFARLGKKDFNYAQTYLNEESTPPLDNHLLYIFLGILPIISFVSSFLIGASGLIIAVLSLCVNTIFYLIKKGQLEIELGAMNYLVQGISLSSVLSKKETPLKNELTDNVKTFKSALTLGFAFRVKSGSESEIFIEMLGAAFLLPFISYVVLSKKIKENQKNAQTLWHLMGQLEVAIAVLNLRTIYQDYSCQPTFVEHGITAENVIHPLLNHPVPNPINWERNTLITGSNASGKSTYVRSVAINIIFAQTLNTCLATSFHLQRGSVISSMGVQDSVVDGDSYFIAELKSLKRLIEQVQTDIFCYSFIDEILKGTNTIERIAASSSIIEWLTTQNQLAFIATHDVELPQILHENCDNIHFEESVTKEDGITFDYLLKNGVATSRNAINLIESMDFPATVIKNAHQKAEFFDKNRSWND